MLIQAEKLSQIMDGRRVWVLNWVEGLILAVIAAIGGVALAMLPISLLFKALIVLAVAAGYLVLLWWVGMNGGPVLPFVSPIAAFAVATAFGETFDGAQARRERKLIRQAFQQFISPAVVQQLMDDPSKLELRGEEREISTIFTDLQGFTALTAVCRRN